MDCSNGEIGKENKRAGEKKHLVKSKEVMIIIMIMEKLAIHRETLFHIGHQWRRMVRSAAAVKEFFNI